LQKLLQWLEGLQSVEPCQISTFDEREEGEDHPRKEDEVRIPRSYHLIWKGRST
jgi:hypothetical protein